jgi:hypothetical protein
MSAPSSDVSPDLLVTVNFTTLGMFDNSLVDARTRTVSILVGLTNNTNDVVANTIPTPIFPGLSLAGNVSRRFKRRFVKPPLASLGIFGVSQSLITLPWWILTNACYSLRRHSLWRAFSHFFTILPPLFLEAQTRAHWEYLVRMTIRIGNYSEIIETNPSGAA